MIIQEISFEQICQIWQEQLWPNRVSPIETHSAMTWPFVKNSQEYDMRVFDYQPTFWGVYDGTSLIGVNSGHKTENTFYRSRGIWVHPEFRKKGTAQLLFSSTEEKAIEEGCDMIWSIPRKSALPSYTRFGFKTVGNFFDEGMEFGPNIYVKKELTDENS